MQVRLLAYQVFLSLPRIYLSCFYVRMQEKKYCLNSFKELEEEEKSLGLTPNELKVARLN